MNDQGIDILIIDDDVNVRKTFGNILKFKGYRVEGAGTGAEAIACVKSKFFNIAVIDMRLPDISGFEVLKTICGIHDEMVPIMITAYASMDSAIEAMNRGAYSYVTKPVNMDEVLAVIGRALEKQRLSMDNKRLLHDLKTANERLKELDELKSHFVAMVSHEIQNPLFVINESFSLLMDGIVGAISPEQNEVLAGGKKNTERLIRLVTNLLDIAKIESGKREMQRENFDVGALINEILVNYERGLAKKNLSLKKDVQQDIGKIWADRDMISEVVINLLSNAIKYTPEGGNVTVKLEGNAKEIRMEISDSGSGIPEDQREKIFDKFTRITAEKQEGTGLGLPIAKEIVGLHKGKIWVESEPGQGSHFIVTIPRDFRA